MRRGTVWVIGVLGVVALWGVAVAMKARPVERHVALTTATELQRRGLDRRFESLSIQVEGRDLILIGTALSPADHRSALDAAAATPGVSRVVDRIRLAPEAKPFVFRAIRAADGSTMLAGVVPSLDLLDRVVVLGRSAFGASLQVSLRLARGAPQGDWFAAAKGAIELSALIERGEVELLDTRLTVRGRAADDARLDAVAEALARLMPAGYAGTSELLTQIDEALRGPPTASVTECQALFDRMTAAQPIRFPAAPAALTPPPRLFDRLALAARRCSSLFLHIFGASEQYGGDPAAHFRLSEARARAVAGELVRRGVASAHVVALGRGRIEAREPSGDVSFRVSDSAVPAVRPYVWHFEKRADGSGIMSGHHPSPEAERALADLARPALRGSFTDESRLAHGAPPGDWLAAAELAIESVAQLDEGAADLADDELSLRGIAKDDESQRAIEDALSRRVPKGFRARIELTTALDAELARGEIADAATCQTLFDSVARTGAVEFVFDGPALFTHQRRLFGRLAAASRRCQSFILEIGGHGNGAGDPEASRALSERWAQAVADALSQGGVERRRLRAVGFGNTSPLADAASEAGRLRNRRIVFRIVP